MIFLSVLLIGVVIGILALRPQLHILVKLLLIVAAFAIVATFVYIGTNR
jgi:hypothetical protein